MALYEADCALIGEPGSVACGPEDVRAGLKELLDLKGQARLTTRAVVQVGDLALLSCSWTLQGVGPDDKPLMIGGVTAEVARRQPNGSWRYVIDNAVADQTIKA
jgi:ketosteroid isomerase-like protein